MEVFAFGKELLEFTLEATIVEVGLSEYTLVAVFLLLILCSRISTSSSELSSSNVMITTSEVLILLFDAWFEKSLEDLFSDLHSLCEFPVPDWLDPPCNI